MREGSGEGVLERENIFERLGKSALVGRDRVEPDSALGFSSSGGGATHSSITDADSLSSVSPNL